MCGILVYKKKGNNKYIGNRGPDSKDELKKGEFTFVHSLLSITGSFTKQPLVDGNIVCLFNGEIYDRKFVESDGEVIIPLYKKYGGNFAQHLNGEFAIALYDFDKKEVIFATDTFGTKPLWVNGIECGSLESGVGGERLQPNTILVKDFSDKIINEYKTHTFDFDNQTKESYDDWCTAFDKAVEKRLTLHCFIGLSSGYDSGAIDCSLKKLGSPHKSYSVINNENPEVLMKRNPDELIALNQELLDQSEKVLKDHADDYSYERADGSVFKDGSSKGLTYICNRAMHEGKKVYISGQGADEIYGDYKMYPGQSNFHNNVTDKRWALGHKLGFPDDLKEWKNFRGDMNRDYIMKEELVSGAFGKEGRYPFLDKDVVQEFLWLTPELKNKNYKAPIEYYLTKNKYPFKKDEKRGFNPTQQYAV